MLETTLFRWFGPVSWCAFCKASFSPTLLWTKLHRQATVTLALAKGKGDLSGKMFVIWGGESPAIWK